jgi:hypothetical protein
MSPTLKAATLVNSIVCGLGMPIANIPYSVTVSVWDKFHIHASFGEGLFVPCSLDCCNRILK